MTLSAAMRAMLLMAALLASGTVFAQSPAPRVETDDCRGVMSAGASFVEQCGDRLYAWALRLSDIMREVQNDYHGRIYFNCPIELMCRDELSIAGRFLNLREWKESPRDERALFERGDSMAYPPRPSLPMPALSCPLFDISIAGMAGKAVCFDESAVKSGNVVAVVADDRVAVLLIFSHKDKSSAAVREKMVELLPRFKLERATGDAALMKWFDEIRSPRLPRN